MAIGYSTFFCFVLVSLQEVVNSAYLGKSLGKLSEYHHGVSGEVFAVDGRTLHIKDFTYDGEGPAAYFWAGSTRTVGNQGFRIRDENGRPDVLRKYKKEGVTITLPEGKTLRDIKWFSVWCEEFEVNFGDVKISRSFDFPKPQKLSPLRGVHGISSDNIVIVDAQTILIPNLSYDGEAPDAKFWAGSGSKPSPQGIRIPDENGKETPLRKYDGKTVVLTLPGDLTVFDIGHFGIWCEAFTVDFGHIQIPAGLNVPPSLKMLGVSPQSKLNCEVLQEGVPFEVRWAIAGDTIVVQLLARLEPGEYMAFGVSEDRRKSKMIGGDVAVARIDKDTFKAHVDDYYLQDKSQCSGPTGSCPDERFKAGTNSVQLLNAATVNGYTIVTYRRPLKASDEYDLPIITNATQAIIWAMGPLNQRNEVSYHTNYYTKGDFLLDFGRSPKWNCPMTESEQSKVKGTTREEPVKREEVQTATEVRESVQSTRNRGSDRRRGPSKSESGNLDEEATRPSTRRPSERRGSNRGTQKSPIASRDVPTPAPVKKREAWEIPPIQCNEPEDGVFYAQMGPTGGKHGYPAITGHVGWGISWYINGLLIPEINVVRGKTYTFVVEGGLDPEVPARYHPFYITDDPIGGYEYKTPEERQSVKIFAGISDKEGKVIPTGVGRLCHWTHQGDTDADDFESFGAYQRTLELKCDQGEPGVIQWTPDKNTPDTVYYQCFTHRYLGWKINVHDRCDLDGEGSELQPVYASPDKAADLEASPSISVETRVKPNQIVEYQKTYPSQPDAYYHQEDVNLSPPPIVFVPIDAYSNQTLYAQRPVDNVPQLTYRNPPPRTPYVSANTLRRPVPHNRPPFMIKNHRSNRPNNNVAFKKPLYKPIMKPPMAKRPLIKYENPKAFPGGGNIALLPPIYIKTNEHKQDQLMNVEISPLQASTEREPNSPYEINLPPAVNTGFHPETIVVEGGFRPIIRKEMEHRVSEQNGPELEYESSIGVIDVHSNAPPQLVPRSSSAGKKHANKINKRASTKKDIRLILKRPRSQGFESDEDIKSEAAERIESYYLPPTNKKPETKDSPPETVITYDGKKVSGASLSIRINESLSPPIDTRTSKASDLLKSTPQFTLFKGELPPLNQAYIDLNAPQLKSKGGLSRNLDTPDLPSPTTRLRPIRNGNDEPKERSKRSPHHTLEHTEEQRRANSTKSSANLLQTSYVVIIALLFAINLN